MVPNKFKEDTTQLADIEGLLKGHVNGKVLKHEIRPLTAYGENFGSEILRVEVTVEDNGQQHILHAVAKLIPPTEMQLEIFNTQVTFKNEMGFFSIIVPLLQDFQREYRFAKVANYFPQLYGARINLKSNSDVVDTDGAILMENLAIEGYRNLDRFEGFDLDGAKQVLRVLANLQATAIAIKFKKSDEFFSKIRPLLTDYKIPSIANEKNDLMPFQIEPYLRENPGTATIVPRINRLLSKMRMKKTKKSREPWATIVHNDLWVNNIMVKATNGDIKLVDFQDIEYGSPVIDLLFFLFTSVQAPVLRYHFSKLILFYYNEFVETLKQCDVDGEDFSYESFQDELKLEFGPQIYHSLFMLNVVFGPKDTFAKPLGKVAEWKSIQQTNGSSSTSSHAGPPGRGESNGPGGFGAPSSFDGHGGPSDTDSLDQNGMLLRTWPLACKEKLWFMMEEAAKRKWI